ncbi:MAG: peptidase E [Planctomycetaceae bacterium]|nr:peptidase E [Planctomycetaceae bacterium]
MPDHRHIVAMGGLSRDRDNGPLIDYCLRLSERPRPRLGFIATASGDAQEYVERFGQIASGLECEPSHLPFFARTPDVAEWVAAQDVILVGGGNTKSMLAVWREWGLPALLRDAWERGTVLCGWSAGAICWFEQGVTDSYAGRLESLECLGFLPGSCCPHFNGEADRRPEYHRLLSEDRIQPGIAIDDCVGVHYVDTALHQIVRIDESASAYKVTMTESGVVEEVVSA